MLIEDTDALYMWLTTCLGRMCDADPAALAKYVMALVKKDKPALELKEFCSDQLDVFLSKQTKAFVDLLFDTLRSKSYLQNSVPAIDVPVTESTSPVKNFNGNVSTIKTITPCVPVQQNVDEIFPSTLPVQTDVPEQANMDSEMCTDVLQKNVTNPSRSSSSESSKRSGKDRGRSRSRSRETDDNQRWLKRGSDDERHRRQFPSMVQRYDNRHRNNRSQRDREFRRDRERSSMSGNDRQRSYRDSKERSRSRSWDRNNNNRSRSSSSSSESRSWSRDNSNNSQSDHGDTDYRVGSDAHKSRDSKSKKPKRGAKRCKDYDEKGFCMRGELCPFDHGADPLVVEDVSVLSFAPSGNPPAATTNVGCALPPMMSTHHEGGFGDSTHPPLPPSSPPLPPPPPPLPPPPGTFAPEPYNPEAPGIFRKRDPPPIVPWSAPLPNLHPSIIMQPLRLPLSFNPSEPPPGFHVNPKLQRARELIGVPTVDTVPDSNMHVPTPPTSISDQNSNVSANTTITNVQSNASLGGVSTHGSYPRTKVFDFNRLGIRKPIRKGVDKGRCTLELRKVPRHLNSIEHLNKHFSKFGPVTSILTSYDGDSEAAIVEFANHAAATAAYRCSEAVLNNRFIKVFWHYKDSGSNVSHVAANDSHESNASDILDQSGTDSKVSNPQEQSSDIFSMRSSNFPKQNDVAKGKMEADPDKATIFSQKGNLVRTIFNPAAMKKNNVAAVNPGLRKTKQESRKEAVKIRIELQKKKQTILQSHVESQKILLDKLSKSKSDKEKEYLKKTILDLESKISKLQVELKKECEEISALSKGTPANGKYLGNKSEAEREILDAELDLYNQQRKRDEASELMFRISQLRQQSMDILLGKTSSSIRGRSGEKLAHHRGRGRGVPMSAKTRSLDHRTRKLVISNPCQIESDDLKCHLSHFGDIEQFEAVSNIEATVSYKSRKEAENAYMSASQPSPFNLRIPVTSLDLRWCHDVSLGHGNMDVSGIGKDNECDQDQFMEEEEEEDEDEDSEARSWRR